jgi:hypothetical protein
MKRRVHNLGPPEQQQAKKTTVVVKSSGKNVSHVRITEAPKLDSRHAWARLHLQEIGDVNWLYRWSTLIPGTCSCRNDASEILKKLPPVYDSPESWFEWTINFHNAVNTKLNKPTVSLDRAYMLWRHRRPATDRTRAIITVANGTQFVEMLRLTRPFMQSYADRVNADLVDLDNDTESWGPLEKFRVWYFAQQYDEVLFVDADCVIKPECPDLFSMYTQSIVAHDDWSRLYKTDWLERERATVAAKTGVSIEHTAQCLNSGVVLSRRSSADTWKRPEADIGTSHCAEQIWLEHCIDKRVKEGATFGRLDVRANWQWWFSTHYAGAFEAGLKDAWIVHFANAANRLKLIGDYINTL